MPKPFKPSTALLLFGAAVVVWVVALQYGKSATMSPPIATDLQSRSTRSELGASVTEPVPYATIVDRATPRTGTPLIDGFATTTNGRALVLEYWQRPEEGGRFYASALVDQCHAISAATDLLAKPQADLPSPDPIVQVRIVAAFNRIQARCAQFTSDEYKIFSRRSLLTSKDRSDKLMRVVQDVIDASRDSDPARKLEQIKKVMSLADPLVMDDLGIRLAISDSYGGSGVWFDGVKYFLKDDPPIVAAFYLLPCGFGLNCDMTDSDLELRCITGGTCYENRFQRVLQEFAGGNQAKYEDILKSYAAVSAAVRSAELSKFEPK